MRGIETEGLPEAQLPRGNSYLLAIGIDEYRQMPRLYNAVKDARDIIEVLTGDYQFDKDEEHCKALFNEEATQDNIIAAFDQLAQTIKERDTLLVYFSGHGEYQERIDTGYWIPYDGREGRIGSYIGFDLIKKYVAAIDSFHTFIIADSCYSGHLFAERNAASALDAIESIPSRWLLTAGRNEVVFDGKPGDNSPFADAILWILRNNNEPRIAAAEFCQRVQVDVKSNASQLPRGEVMQGVGHRGGQFMFRLKKFKDAIFEEEAKAVAKPSVGASRAATGASTQEPAEPQPKKMEPLRTLEDVRTRLKDHIRQDEFQEAFELLNKIIDGRSRRENDVIMQQSQFNGINKQLANGTVDPAFAQMTLNRIRLALNSLTDKLEEKDFKPGALQPELPDGNGNHGGAYLDELERKGLEEQRALLTEKLNYLRRALTLAYDPSQKFTLEMQIRDIEEQLEEVKGKLTK